MFAADTIHPNKPLQAKLDHLFTLKRAERNNLTIRPEYFTLLDRLGNPHKNLPPVIHVAGTNGKGSTIAFMRAILEAAGYKAHVYTSPHLIRFNERIALAGVEISDAALSTLLDEVLAANDGMEQSFFEITTALAFTAFARTSADIVLLETGLGGRLDSTNVIDHPLATVITTLSHDHMEFLGDTMAAIAREKGGIIKAGSPCIVAHQSATETLPILKARAEALKAPFFTENEGWVMTGSPEKPQDHFTVQTRIRSLKDLPPPTLLGAHQVRNAVTALATLLIQDRFSIPETAFAQGLKSAFWPARLQRIELPLLPPGWEMWLDGGHNDSAAMALADQARIWAADGKDLHIITGMMGHKDVAAFAKPLAALASDVTCITLENGHSPEYLAQIWREEGAREVHIGPELGTTLIHNLTNTKPPGRILITGSLYLAQMVAKL